MVLICIIVRGVVGATLGMVAIGYCTSLVNAKIVLNTRILLQYYAYVNTLFEFLRWQEKGK